jgi:hypothetical protein
MPEREATNTERIAPVDASKEIRSTRLLVTSDESYLRDRLAASRSTRRSWFWGVVVPLILFAAAAGVIVFAFAPRS